MSDCHLNKFCYVCGIFKSQNLRVNTSNNTFKSTYEQYFNQPVFENASYVPDKVCDHCYNFLNGWSKKTKISMPFKVPMMWFPLDPHDAENCYGCKNFRPSLGLRKPHQITYESTPNGQLPIEYGAGESPPRCPSPDLASWLATTEHTETSEEPSSWQPSHPSTSKVVQNKSIEISQQQLDTLVAKLQLSKTKSEMLASFLKEHKVLARGVKVTGYRNRQKELQNFFVVTEDRKSAYCNNIVLLMLHMEINYNADEWRLFIDSSKNSLKAVLLHKTNKKPAIPIAYSTDTKETYARMKTILDEVGYDDHKWRICCDLKVVAMLCGLQGGWTKRPCFICDWDSRYNKEDQYARKNWKERQISEHGGANVINPPLVPRDKVLLPQLHLKLGIVKNFIKTIVKDARGKVVVA